METKITITVRGCSTSIEPHDGGAYLYDTAPGGYESADHIGGDGHMMGQGFVGSVDADEKDALTEARDEAVRQGRARWPQVDAAFRVRETERAEHFAARVLERTGVAAGARRW